MRKMVHLYSRFINYMRTDKASAAEESKLKQFDDFQTKAFWKQV